MKIKIQDNNFFFIICLLITVFYGVYFIQYGVDFNDTFFNAIPFVVYQETGELNPLFFLTSLSGYSIIKFFGNQIIYFKLFHALISLATIFLPLLLINSYKERLKVLPYILLISLIYAPVNQYILNYDTFAYFFIFIHIIILIRYIQNCNYWHLILLSFISAISVGFKLPLIILPVLVCGILLVYHLLNSKLKAAIFHIFVYILLFLFFYFTIIYLIFGDINVYYTKIFESSDQVGYTFSHLMIGYLRSFVSIIILLAVISFLFYHFRNYQNTRVFKTKYFFILVAFWILYFLIIFNMRLAWRTAILLSSLYLFVLILHLYYALDSKKFNVKKLLLIHFVFIAFYFVPAAGSDTGLTKTAIMFLFVSYFISRNYFKSKKFVLFFLIIILPFTIYDRFDQFFGEKSFVKMNTTVKQSNHLKFIKTTKPKADLINDIIMIAREYQNKGQEVVFVSLFSHFFTYELNKAEVKVSKNFRMDVEKPQVVDEISTFINKQKVKPVVIYIQPYYPESFESQLNHDFNAKNDFEKMLMNQYQYKKMKNRSFEIFIPLN